MENFFPGNLFWESNKPQGRAKARSIKNPTWRHCAISDVIEEFFGKEPAGAVCSSPPTRAAHSSQVPGHLTAPPAKSHTAAPIQTAMACTVFLQIKPFFPSIISLLIYMTTEKQWIPLQRHRPMKLCLGLMESNHWLVQFKVHHYHSPCEEVRSSPLLLPAQTAK